MQVNMLEAKNRLSSLIVPSEQGEEVVIARNRIPVAKIVKYDAPRIKPPGAWRGKVAYSTDCLASIPSHSEGEEVRRQCRVGGLRRKRRG